MTWQACAKIVETGDPLRFRTVMAAPRHVRPVLFPLYAFNVEASRAPWLTQEPMIAEMRLQWWRDALEEIAEGGPVRRHEVATPLAEILTAEDAKRLDELVASRRWDIYREPFEDQTHWDNYIDQTAGHLMWTAARLLGGKSEQQVRDLAFSAGTAAFLRAVPELEAAGRIPLIDGSPEGVQQLAKRAIAGFSNRPRKINAALWTAAGTLQTLKQVVRNPGDVAQDRLDPGMTSWRLIKASVFNRI